MVYPAGWIRSTVCHMQWVFCIERLRFEYTRVHVLKHYQVLFNTKTTNQIEVHCRLDNWMSSSSDVSVPCQNLETGTPRWGMHLASPHLDHSASLIVLLLAGVALARSNTREPPSSMNEQFLNLMQQYYVHHLCSFLSTVHSTRGFPGPVDLVFHRGLNRNGAEVFFFYL